MHWRSLRSIQLTVLTRFPWSPLLCLWVSVKSQGASWKPLFHQVVSSYWVPIISSSNDHHGSLQVVSVRSRIIIGLFGTVRILAILALAVMVQVEWCDPGMYRHAA